MVVNPLHRRALPWGNATRMAVNGAILATCLGESGLPFAIGGKVGLITRAASAQRPAGE